MIICDTHEGGSGVPGIVSDLADESRTESLNAGDYLVRDTIIERKTTADFIGRLQGDENNIFAQLYRMKLAAEEQDLRPVLLLEGPWHDGFRHSKMPMHAVIGALAGVFKMGLSIVSTPSPEGTARFLATLETKSTAGKPQKIRDEPATPTESRPEYLIQGFEGVGAKTANALLDHFGSVRAIVNADSDELTKVSGVGAKTAKGIIRDVT